MLKSMTGYGKGESVTASASCTVEIRSVNHRYGEISLKMPRMLFALEQEAKKTVAATLKRGKIDLFVQWNAAVCAEGTPLINREIARLYYQELNLLKNELGLAQEVPLSLVLAQKGVQSEGESSADPDEYREQFLDAVRKAVSSLDAMRTHEGKALADDLRVRRSQLAVWVDEINSRAPVVVSEYRQKLQTRIEGLSGGIALDESRLAQEVALLADRSDITEELVRLASHFIQFDNALNLPEPVGRKLDFLMQEMNREVNTIGSKSNDADITTLVVQMKAEMEKMREQVQNIE